MPSPRVHSRSLARTCLAAVAFLAIPVTTCNAAMVSISVGSAGADGEAGGVAAVSIGVTSPAPPAPSEPAGTPAPAPPPSAPTPSPTDVAVVEPNTVDPATERPAERAPATPAPRPAEQEERRVLPGWIVSRRTLEPDAIDTEAQARPAAATERSSARFELAPITPHASIHRPAAPTTTETPRAAVDQRRSGAPQTDATPRLRGPSVISSGGAAPVAVPALIDAPAVRHQLLDIQITPTRLSSYCWAMWMERPG